MWPSVEEGPPACYLSSSTMASQLHPFIFDPSSGTWIQDHSKQSLADTPAAITLATWNVWFAPYYFDVRAEQLAEIFPRLEAAGADCLLAGDFNFCSSWASENANVAPEFVDLWPALHGRAAGYTEDTDLNTMLRNVKRKEKRVRFDRVLLRSPGGAWRPRSIEVLGTEPISEATPDVFPSDHFGLAAVIVPLQGVGQRYGGGSGYTG